MKKLEAILESLSVADKTYLASAEGFLKKAKAEISSAESDLSGIKRQLAGYQQSDPEKGHDEIAELMIGVAEELEAFAGGIKSEFEKR